MKLYIAIPSRDGFAHMTSLLNLLRLQEHGFQLHFAFGMQGNIPRARNNCQKELTKLAGPRKTLPVLWWDTDVIIRPEQIKDIAISITKAMATNDRITGAYNSVQGVTVLFQNGKRLTVEELTGFPYPQKIDCSGFGFLFDPFWPVDYTFYADEHGEDVNFFITDKGLLRDTYFYPGLIFGHQKIVEI